MFSKKYLVLLPCLLVCFVIKVINSKSCKALAMSGGGAHGALEAGVLWGLIKNDEDK